MYSRTAYVNQMRRYLGAVQGDINHKHIVDTYNAHSPLARGYKVKYTDPWCATTVSAAAIECGYTDIIPTECSCTRMIDLLKNKDSWEGNDNYTPKPGDIIFYNWDAKTDSEDVDGLAHHTGVVEFVENGKITVIEGNKDSKCARRIIPIGWRYIHSFGIPKFDAEEINNEVYHIVQPHEYLSIIAPKYGIPWKDIAILNGIKFPYIIRPGQKLRIK